jgi:hypothetical protein
VKCEKGKVMTCEAFAKIFEAVMAIRPGGQTAGCPGDW